mmetsp:Transcript_118854/g.236804  ORF Transcript_118854/g.236804 Transcript_118854/m.236804 type:complete len:134 (-) Transcript_118854:12-413(-)
MARGTNIPQINPGGPPAPLKQQQEQHRTRHKRRQGTASECKRVRRFPPRKTSAGSAADSSNSCAGVDRWDPATEKSGWWWPLIDTSSRILSASPLATGIFAAFAPLASKPQAKSATTLVVDIIEWYDMAQVCC